jgi:hypothetical protein
MTVARYTGHVQHTIEVLQDGRVLATMDVAKFCAIDYDLSLCAERAMDSPGTLVPVPAQTMARGLRPRNSVRHGVTQ